MTEKYLDQDFPLLAAKGGFYNALSFCMCHPKRCALPDEPLLLAVAGKSKDTGLLVSYEALRVVERSLTLLRQLDQLQVAETDPHGKNLNSPGAKADAGKVRPALVLGGFARALLEVSKVGTGGAVKYTESGWIEVPNGQDRYDDAGLRHWLYEKAGQAQDPDTKLLHAAHDAWNALARLDLMLRELEKESQQVHMVGGVAAAFTPIPTPAADFLKATNR